MRVAGGHVPHRCSHPGFHGLCQRHQRVVRNQVISLLIKESAQPHESGRHGLTGLTSERTMTAGTDTDERTNSGGVWHIVPDSAAGTRLFECKCMDAVKACMEHDES
jgi:hypothetical protein